MRSYFLAKILRNATLFSVCLLGPYRYYKLFLNIRKLLINKNNPIIIVKILRKTSFFLNSIIELLINRKNKIVI